MSIGLNGLPSNHYSNALKYNSDTRLVKKEETHSTGDNGSASSLAEVISTYQSTVLTGVRELTAAEKEEIKSLIEAYLKETGFLEKYSSNNASKADHAALHAFIKGLFAQFGSKSDFYGFAAGFVDGILGRVVNPNHPPNPRFEVEIPPEHTLASTPQKPMFIPFQSLSPHQLPGRA